MKGKLLGHEIKQFTGWDIDNKFDFEMVKYILKINNKKLIILKIKEFY